MNQYPYLPATDDDRKAMLKAIGAASTAELFDVIPEKLRFKKKLDLPAHMTEMELAAEFGRLAASNKTTSQMDSYLGAGAYEHYIPSVVRHLLGRSEFYTSYTPYQPEITQGMLQAIYEYQSMICTLTGMEVSNASLYEGGHALAESVLMACAATGRKKVVLGAGVHPEYLQVLKTYALPQAIEVVLAPALPAGTTDLEALRGLVDEKTAGLVVCNPNFFGCLEQGQAFADMAHAQGALLVACCEPISLGLLAPPGEFGADIACGEGQPLGIPLGFGGPWVGFIASRLSLVRRMPGRLCGITKDNRGQRGFVLTLQTREQHIRREKATSNICTNQTLLALAATIYLSALGPRGLKEVASSCLHKAHYLAGEITKAGLGTLSYAAPYFAEFTLKLNQPADTVLAGLQAEGILGGVALSRFYPERRNELLVCATETKSKAQLDRYVKVLAQVCKAAPKSSAMEAKR